MVLEFITTPFIKTNGAFIDLFRKGYEQWTTWIFDYTEKDDEGSEGVWTLYDLSQEPAKKITDADAHEVGNDYVFLHNRILQFALTQLQKTLPETVSDPGWNSILSRVEKEFNEGLFIEKMYVIASEMSPSFEADEERLWKMAGGDTEAMLQTFYEKKSLLKEIIFGKYAEEEYLISEILETCSTLPLSLQHTYLVVTGDNHSFCCLPEKMNQQELSSQKARQEWISQRVRLAKRFVRKFPEATEQVLAAENPVRELIIEAALQNGGLQSKRVKDIREKMNQKASLAAFEKNDGHLAFPFCDTNYFDGEGFIHCVGIDVDVSEGTLICGDYKSVISDFNTPDFEFDPEDYRDNYTIYLA